MGRAGRLMEGHWLQRDRGAHIQQDTSPSVLGQALAACWPGSSHLDDEDIAVESPRPPIEGSRALFFPIVAAVRQPSPHSATPQSVLVQVLAARWPSSYHLDAE